MTNQQRLNKLTEALHLIREVEFSYEHGSQERRVLYKFVVDNFSLTGTFPDMIDHLNREIEAENEKQSL